MDFYFKTEPGDPNTQFFAPQQAVAAHSMQPAFAQDPNDIFGAPGSSTGFTMPPTPRDYSDGSPNNQSGVKPGSPPLADDQENKRKAQNRAAQRAFRERKEKKVKELEDKLTEAEEQMQRLASENERLKKENTVITTKNAVLQEQTVNPSGHSPITRHLTPSFPVQEQFFTPLLEKHGDTAMNDPSFLVYNHPNKSGEVVLGAGAIWQKIMESEENSDLDIEFVVQYLKNKARCDGFGPVFALSDVNEGIRLARGQF